MNDQETHEDLIVEGVEKAKRNLAKQAKDFFGVNMSGFPIVSPGTIRDLPDSRQALALVQAGVDYYQAIAKRILSTDSVARLENEVKLTDYQRALEFVQGTRKNPRSFFIVMKSLSDDVLKDAAAELKQACLQPSTQKLLFESAVNRVKRVELSLKSGLAVPVTG